MMNIGVLMLGTLRETLRDRLLIGLLTAGGLVLLGLVLLSPMTLGARDKTFHDFGLAWIHLSGILILSVLGAWSLHRERERGIWLGVLARPITRYEYIAGRLLGLLGNLVLTLVAAAALYVVIALAAGIGPVPGLAAALLYIFMEMCILAGLVLFFSTFTGFAMTFFLALAVFLAGHLGGDLIRFASLTHNPVLGKLALAVHWLLPQLDLYRVRADLVAGTRPAVGEIVQGGVYMLLYLGVLLSLSCAIFGRKELK